jgi:hypothetical protein
MVVYSPQKAITYSIDSIPLSTTQLTFIMSLTFSMTPSHNLSQSQSPTVPCKILLNQLINFLTHFTTDDEFNQSVDKLPPTLTHLTTGFHFNQPVDKLPSTLIHLTTGFYFNQPVDKLPPTLTPSQLEVISSKQLAIFHSLTSQLDFISTIKLINFHLHSLTSQLEVFSTNQLTNFHPHSLISW